MIQQAKRKGAVRIELVPDNILEQLNRGEIETANLTEGLAIDQMALLRYLLTSINRQAYIEPILKAVLELPKGTFNTIGRTIGEKINLISSQYKDHELLEIMSSHPSDTVRSWTCYVLASKKLGIDEYLEQIRPFAEDHHFAVREISWLSIRPHIIKHLDRSIALLEKWVLDANPYVRRFAIESTRPRGVWSQHINKLKEHPSLATNLLNPLKSDPSRYVQDSVANWLNDASKTTPEFVLNLTEQWRSESNTPETDYIIRRALRTIRK